MRRKVLTIVLILFVLVNLTKSRVLAIETTNGTCGNNAIWTLDSTGKLTITGTGIINDGGWNKDSIKKVEIGEGIIEIGESAFDELQLLEEVTLPDSLRTIGWGAFNECIKLKKINIPDNVETIKDHAFHWCNSLDNINIPSKMSIINDYTFYGCKAFTTIEIPENIEKIGCGAFGQ